MNFTTNASRSVDLVRREASEWRVGTLATLPSVFRSLQTLAARLLIASEAFCVAWLRRCPTLI